MSESTRTDSRQMRVLWFAHVPPSGFRQGNGGYNGGGWISSLQLAMEARGDVDLAIAFFTKISGKTAEELHVSYFPMHRTQSFFPRVKRFFLLSKQDQVDIAVCKKVIADFKPDVIQVFGTESGFGLLARETDIPFVIHLQGLMGPYMDAWVPPRYRMLDYAWQGTANPIRIALGLRALAFNRHAVAREREIMRFCKAFMGRTDWDRAFVSLYAPQARYFTCWETLRPCFYEPADWTPPSKPVFVSTISGPLYKGHDMVLKTARTLKESGLDDFMWKVFGIDNLRFAERKTGIRASDVGVVPKGVATAEQLRAALLSCSVYVHPSYIDNSPNSLCEAQVLGVPVVATNVGGVSSLFTANHSYCLVPANDPLMMAERIRQSLTTPQRFISDREECLHRHAPETVVGRLMDIYMELVGQNHLNP